MRLFQRFGRKLHSVRVCRVLRNRTLLTSPSLRRCSSPSTTTVFPSSPIPIPSISELRRIADPSRNPYSDLLGEPGFSDIPELQQFSRLLNVIDEHVLNQDTKIPSSKSSSSSLICASKLSSLERGESLTRLGLSTSEWLTAVDSALMTHCLHIQSRLSSFNGRAFYTIGPCGEESLAPIGLELSSQDSMALHYRHLSTQIARIIKHRTRESSSMHTDHHQSYSELNLELISEVLTSRARGYCVSRYDPISEGKHCLLGGGPNDYLVTSTLASQMTQAVGRALGTGLARKILGFSMPVFPNDSHHHQQQQQQPPVSYVSVGDGSVNNSHFLSAVNTAEYACVSGLKCPLIIGISNNELCISLRDQNQWLSRHLSRYHGKRGTEPNNEGLFDLFRVENGSDMLQVWTKFRQAYESTVKRQKPCLFVIDGIIRQFGHAATDRQAAYMDSSEMEARWDSSVIYNLFLQSCDRESGVMTAEQFRDRLHQIANLTRYAFENIASKEPKWGDFGCDSDRSELMSRNSPSLDLTHLNCDGFAGVHRTRQLLRLSEESLGMKKSRSCSDHLKSAAAKEGALIASELASVKRGRRNPMRKLMTGVIEECLRKYPECVYIGEDVRHGGYYLVTDGLSSIKDDGLGSRLFDFPPDETSIVGAGLGFAQSGLLPIVEIPYAKYLDCSFDIFNECGILHWLANPNNNNNSADHEESNEFFGRLPKKGTPMMIRLQGFGNGLFGGNFHTHNVIHRMPGLDVVCYSNGSDYVKGWRFCMHQVRSVGRFVMSVDCTKLLNLRGSSMMQEMPHLDKAEFLGFDDVIVYTPHLEGDSSLLCNVSFHKTIVSDIQRDPSVTPTNSDESYNESFDLGEKPIVLVSYGLGIEICKEAVTEMYQCSSGDCPRIFIVDSPYLSSVPRMLSKILRENERGMRVVFADMCRSVGAPLNELASLMHSDGVLDGCLWRCVNAQPTYNLLGRELTFLSKEDVLKCVRSLDQ